jgi:phage gp37-like protein
MDPYSALEDAVEGVLQARLPDYYSDPLVIGQYAGEFASADVIDVVDDMVRRAPHALVAWMGTQGMGGDDSGEVEEEVANWSIYVAARNLRGETDQRRDAYPILSAAKRIIKSTPTLHASDNLGTESWTALTGEWEISGSEIVVSVPGVVVIQLSFTSRLLTLWGQRLSQPEIQAFL